MVDEKPSLLPGVLFGLGLGGFVDGIVLHEILQWHHMISSAESSNTLSGLELNVVADGFFHVVTWLLVMAGSIMTLVSWRKGRLAPTWSFHFGLLLAGWGIFNIIEGLIDHQLLGIHHVRDDLGGPLSWDIGFLLFCGMPSTISRWPLHWRRWPPSLCQASRGLLILTLAGVRVGYRQAKAGFVVRATGTARFARVGPPLGVRPRGLNVGSRQQGRLRSARRTWCHGSTARPIGRSGRRHMLRGWPRHRAVRR